MQVLKVSIFVPSSPELQLPANLCAPSTELADKVSALALPFATLEEKNQVYTDHQTNLSLLTQRPILLTDSFITELKEQHCILKGIEQTTCIEDIKEIEVTDQVEKKYLEVSRRIATKELQFTQEVSEKYKAIGNTYTKYFFPAPETPRFKLIQSRQALLKVIEKGLIYLESKGFRSVWKVPTDRAIELLTVNKSGADLTKIPEPRGIPIKSYENLEKEITDYKDQFSYRFLAIALRGVRNTIRRKQLHMELIQAQYVSLKCIENLARLRFGLEKMNSLNETMSSETIVTPLLSFGYYWGKLKTLEFKDLEERFGGKNLS